MRPTSHVKFAAGLSWLGLLALVSGCSSTPTRQATTEMSTEPALTAMSERVEAPTVLQSVAPVYPFRLRREGITGRVVVSCLIDKEGRVQETRIATTSAEEFNAPAVEAVKKWSFKPATRNGEAVPMRINVPVNFELVD